MPTECMLTHLFIYLPRSNSHEDERKRNRELFGLFVRFRSIHGVIRWMEWFLIAMPNERRTDARTGAHKFTLANAAHPTFGMCTKAKKSLFRSLPINGEKSAERREKWSEECWMLVLIRAFVTRIPYHFMETYGSGAFHAPSALQVWTNCWNNNYEMNAPHDECTTK